MQEVDIFMSNHEFKGRITSVQPRIRLLRSFDEATHSYLGYALVLDGSVDDVAMTFSIGIGQGTQAKHGLKVNDCISGRCVEVADPRIEPVEYYRVTGLHVLTVGEGGNAAEPWETIAPDLQVYRKRGCRRLAVRTYAAQCLSCIWGVRMPVEIIVDNWNPQAARLYRFETFCYGPLNCRHYKAGPERQVPGRKGATYIEDDWVDAMHVEHRRPDE